MWYMFQGAIIFTVIASNIHWQWTPNRYLPVIMGFGIAYGLTSALGQVAAKIRARKEYPPEAAD
jgi:hypothetical protein